MDAESAWPVRRRCMKRVWMCLAMFGRCVGGVCRRVSIYRRAVQQPVLVGPPTPPGEPPQASCWVWTVELSAERRAATGRQGPLLQVRQERQVNGKVRGEGGGREDRRGGIKRGKEREARMREQGSYKKKTFRLAITTLKRSKETFADRRCNKVRQV